MPLVRTVATQLRETEAAAAATEARRHDEQDDAAAQQARREAELDQRESERQSELERLTQRASESSQKLQRVMQEQHALSEAREHAEGELRRSEAATAAVQRLLGETERSLEEERARCAAALDEAGRARAESTRLRAALTAVRCSIDDALGACGEGVAAAATEEEEEEEHKI